MKLLPSHPCVAEVVVVVEVEVVVVVEMVVVVAVVAVVDGLCRQTLPEVSGNLTRSSRATVSLKHSPLPPHLTYMSFLMWYSALSSGTHHGQISYHSINILI